MADYFLQAGQAITIVVQRHYPDDAGNWTNIVPSAKMELGLWDQMSREIGNEFNALIAPCKLKSGTTFLEFLNKELYLFQNKLNDSVVCPGEDGFDA